MYLSREEWITHNKSLPIKSLLINDYLLLKNIFTTSEFKCIYFKFQRHPPSLASLLTTSYPTLQLIYFRPYFRPYFRSASACPSVSPSASFSWIFHNAKLQPSSPSVKFENVEKGRHLERMEWWSSSKARFLQHPWTELPTFLGSKEDFEVTSILILSFF